MWQTEVICALSASGVAPLSRTPRIYRVSDSDGGGRQADYAVCKNRSRGIPFVRRQEQAVRHLPTVGKVGAGKEILRDEGCRLPPHRTLLRAFEINILNRRSAISRHSQTAIEFLVLLTVKPNFKSTTIFMHLFS